MAAILWLLGTGTVFAHAEVDSGNHPGAISALEEVVVTARRREEKLLEVPLAVTALPGEALEARGALDLSSLGEMVPNVQVEAARGTNNAIAAYIRGVGQQDHIAGFESGVGLYVDDVYLNRPQLALLDIYEVERIEVLRGPQGTLYGRNTVGGAIKYVSRRLEFEPALRVRSRVGNHGMRDTILGGSLPLDDNLRIGATLARFRLDGFGRNLALGGKNNYQKEIDAARVSAEWTPTNDWFIRLAGEWVQDDANLRRGHRVMVGEYTGAPVLGNVYDHRSGNAFPVADANAVGLSLSLERQVGGRLILKSIFASRADETWKPVDLDSLPTVDVDVSTWDRNRQYSAEFQAAFSGERARGVFGLFALEATADTVLGVLLGTTGDLIGRHGLGNELQSGVNTRNWALFTDVSLDLGERWTASLGARYTRDLRDSIVKRRTTVGGVTPFFGGPAIVAVTTSDFLGAEVFEKLTPRAAVQWLPGEDHNLYLGYSEGFKGGGFDPRGLSTLAPDSDRDGTVSAAEIHKFMLFKPEELASWELGWKARLLGGRMTSRLAVFLSDYSDVQIPGSVGVDENGDGVFEQWVGITTNAARARIDGFEWEGQVRLAEAMGKIGAWLDLSWALGFTDARFRRFIDTDGKDVSNERVFANTPRWMASVSASYSFRRSWLGHEGQLTLTPAASYRDKQAQVENLVPAFDQRAFTLFDLGLAWVPDGDRWAFSLHGRNLTDVRHKVAGLDIELGLEGNHTVYFGNPRQYWLEIRFRAL